MKEVHVLFIMGGGMLQLRGVTTRDDARSKWAVQRSPYASYTFRTFKVDDPELLEELGLKPTAKKRKKR